MRKTPILLFAFLISINNFMHSQEFIVVPGNLIVMLNSDADAYKLSEQFYYLNDVKTDLKVERVLSESMHIYLFDFNAAIIDQTQLLNAVKKDHSVKIAQFNHTFKERVIPNDTQFGVMWDMNNTGQSGGVIDADIDAPEAWNITTGGLTSQGDTIVVAVVDGGYDLTQQDLNFWKNYKEIPNNGIDDDNNGYIDDHDGWDAIAGNDNLTVAAHGTHVCGTIGAKGNNGVGVTGVNWNVKIMPVSYGSGNLESGAIASYAYIRDQRRLYNKTNGAKGAFVVSTNSSFGVDLGKPSAYPLWCAMYDSLGAVGILSAGATANQNYNVDTQGDIPTACTSKWLISVTNTTRTDAKNGSCGYGLTSIDLGSPGTNITSTLPGNTYGTMTGTSMATPHIAGAIALMYSVPCSELITNYKTDPAGVALMVKDSLLNATDPIAALNGITVTGGRLNLYKAVKSIQNYCIAVAVPENETADNKLEIKSVYPNPASNSLSIVYSSYENVSISIVNVLGQEIKRIQGNNTKGEQHVQIDLSSIDKGIYFISVNASNKKSNTMKIVVY